MKTLTQSKTDSKVIKDLESIAQFQQIVKVLQRYYSSISNSQQVSASFKNRTEVSEASPENVYLEITKFGNFEYQIKGYDTSIKEYSEDCNWIHIDGIAQEREELTAKGILNHPVFTITCLGDIYSNN